MTTAPLVTIVTVVLNGEQYIEDAIQSILAQDYTPLQYIIIDGHSSDRSVEIALRYESYIDRIVSEPDEGIYDAMNKGISYARGDIVGLLNSDDFLETGAIKAIVREFCRNPNVDLVYGAMKILDSDLTVRKVYRSRENWNDCFAAPFNHPATFVRRSVYERIGAFDVAFRTAADYDFMLRFKRHGLPYSYLDRPLVNFRLGGTTSNSVWFPASQIWQILKQNGYGFFARIGAMFYRTTRAVIRALMRQSGLRLFR